jgi:hypothetical protein
MKAGIIVSSVLWLGIAVLTTGCSGIELGGKVGLYAVDERREVQETASKSMPLKCRFVNCAGEGYRNDK